MKTLRLEPAYRDFHKRREATVRRVFNIHVELLEVYGLGYAEARSGSTGIVSQMKGNISEVGDIEMGIATALGIEELRAIGKLIVEGSVEANANLDGRAHIGNLTGILGD